VKQTYPAGARNIQNATHQLVAAFRSFPDRSASCRDRRHCGGESAGRWRLGEPGSSGSSVFVDANLGEIGRNPAIARECLLLSSVSSVGLQ